MYSKFAILAITFAATLAPAGAVDFARDNDQHHTQSYTCTTTTWVDGKSQLNYVSCPTPTWTTQPSQHHQARQAPTGTPTQVSCDGYQPWQSNLAYSAGATPVIYNNQLWTAKSWSNNKTPETAASEWTPNGYCKTPYSNYVYCNYISTWYQGTAYNAGAKVSYKNYLYIAVQYTTSNTPGDTSGTWKELGACYGY